MLQGLLYAVISAASFGSMAVLVKLGYAANLTGSEMMEMRFTYATLLLGVILYFKDKTLLRISRPALLKCAFLGLVVYWLQTTCFVTALATIPASTTALVLYIHPLTVTLLSCVFFKMKLDRYVIASLVLVMGGCCMVFYDAFLRAVDPMGLLYATGAMVFFSCYLLLVQVLLKGVKPLTATLYVMGFAAIAFTISGNLSIWVTQNMTQFTLSLLLGLIPGMIAVTFLYLSIEKIGSAYACIFSSIEPVITLALAAACLDENVVTLQIAGAVSIIAGIVIPNGRTLLVRKQVQI